MQNKIPESIQTLIDRYLTGQISKEELQKLDSWFFHFENPDIEIKSYNGINDPNEIKRKLHQRILNNLDSEPTSPKRWMQNWQKVAAILTIIGSFSAWWLMNPQEKEPQSNEFKDAIALNQDEKTILLKKAYLLLSDSSTIDLATLETKPDGSAKSFHGLSIGSEQGIIRFFDVEKQSSQADYTKNMHQLIVPKGSQYDFYLSDGTRVWMNAHSKLTFPVTFSQTERMVYLEGEAYFEVKSDEDHPFLVKTSGQEIRVTGTSFNVSSYQDDLQEQTTLYEGKVEILHTQSGRIVKLAPGDKGISSATSLEISKFGSSGEAIRAWKSNTFVFENENPESIIRKLSRWYDVESDLSRIDLSENRYSGKIRKSADLNEVIEMLELVMPVRFERNANHLVAWPKKK